jgi:RNA polymerase sigma-70 factor (ECF subfamily)
MNNDRFWTLLEPIHGQAEGFCRRLAGNRDDGDDLYQDSLLVAMRKIGSLRDETAFRPWLFKLIINRFRNRSREAWWRRRASLTPGLLEAALVDDPRDKNEARLILEAAMSVLKAEEKAMLVLYEFEQWTIAELAGLYGKPEGTIKARLSRARSKMRRFLEGRLAEQERQTKLSEGDYGLQKSSATAE